MAYIDEKDIVKLIKNKGWGTLVDLCLNNIVCYMNLIRGVRDNFNGSRYEESAFNPNRDIVSGMEDFIEFYKKASEETYKKDTSHLNPNYKED